MLSKHKQLLTPEHTPDHPLLLPPTRRRAAGDGVLGHEGSGGGGRAPMCRIHEIQKGPRLPKTLSQEHTVHSVSRTRTVLITPPALSLDSQPLVKISGAKGNQALRESTGHHMCSLELLSPLSEDHSVRLSSASPSRHTTVTPGLSGVGASPLLPEHCSYTTLPSQHPSEDGVQPQTRPQGHRRAHC